MAMPMRMSVDEVGRPGIRFQLILLVDRSMLTLSNFAAPPPAGTSKNVTSIFLESMANLR